MAITTEVIRKITLQGSVVGVNEATDAVNKLAAANSNLAVVMDTSAKKQLSAEQAYKRQTLSLVDGAKAQDQLAKATKTADSALAQNVITQDEHAKRIALINQKYGEASVSSKAFAAATAGINRELVALAAGAGPVGVFLAGLGPLGLSAAVGLGVAAKGFTAMLDASHNLAEKAIELRAFSDITGLSTTQVQALRTEAAKFALTSDEAQNSIQTFTARFNELRLGSGELYKQLSRIDPALRDQMAATTDAGQALTLFGQALLKVDDIFQRNALVRAGTNRGGLGSAQFLTGLDVSKVTASFESVGRGLDKDLIDKLRRAQIDIDETTKKLQSNFARIFAVEVLEREQQFLNYLLQISDTLKGAAPGEAFQKFMDWLIDPRIIEAAKAIGNFFANPPGLRQFQPPSTATDPGGLFGAKAGAGGGTPLTDPGGLFGASRSSTGLTLEAQIEQQKKLIAVLGPAATVTEQLALKQKELSLTAKDAGTSVEGLTRGQRGLNAEFALAREADKIAALGSAATVTEQYKLKVNLLSDSLAHGRINQEDFNRSVAGLQLDQTIARMDDTIAALGTLATPTQEYERDVAKLKQRLDQGRISQDTFNKGIIAAAPLFKDLQSAATNFAVSFVQGLAEGKKGIDALLPSLQNLGQQLTSAGINNIIKDPTSLTGYIETGIGVVTSLFTGRKQKEQQEQQAAQQAALQAQQAAQAAAVAAAQAAAEAAEAARQRALGYQNRLFAATNDTSTLAGQLAAFDRQAEQERAEEIKNGGRAINDLEAALGAERVKIVNDYNKQIVDAQKAAFKQILDYVESLKLGELSVLSPQQKLTAAQAQYNKQLDLARGGDKDALASITQTADALLNVAKSFYASSKGYADIYGQVSSDLTTLAGGQAGGIVGRYAGGGMIGNGVYDVDSVMARYAGGGNVALAGGEFVTRASSVNASTLPALQAINSSGTAANDNRNLAGLATTFVSVGNAIVARLAQLEGAYRESGGRAEDAARIAVNRTPRPGKISAAA